MTTETLIRHQEQPHSETIIDQCIEAYFELPAEALKRRQEESLKALTFPNPDELRTCMEDSRVDITRQGNQVYLTTIHPDVLGDYTPTHMIATKTNWSGGASTPFIQGCEQFPNHWRLLQQLGIWEQNRSNPNMLTEPFMSASPTDERQAMQLLRKWGKSPLTAISKEQATQFEQLADSNLITYLIDHISLDRSVDINASQFINSLRETIPGNSCLLIFNAPQFEAGKPGTLTHAFQQTGLPIDIVTQQDYGKIFYSDLEVNRANSIELSVGTMQRMSATEMAAKPALIDQLVQVEHTSFGANADYRFDSSQPFDNLPYPVRSLFDQCFSPDQVKQVLTAPDRLIEKFVYFQNDRPVGYFVQMTEAGIQSDLSCIVTSHNPRAMEYFSGKNLPLRITVNWVKSHQAGSFNSKDLLNMLQFIAPASTFTMFQDTGRQLGNSGLPLMYKYVAPRNTDLKIMETHNLACLGVV